MKQTPEYLFTSARLGFRNWAEQDIEPLAVMNSNAMVMEFFPAVQSLQQTIQFVERMQQQQDQRGYCYFAVDDLETSSFIGFTGLSFKEFEADFTPCVDIGWRFDPLAWNRGFATEAAKRCIEYGFQDLALPNIVSIAPVVNVKSISIMEKAGMKIVKTFEHPLLVNDDRLRKCVLYSIDNDNNLPET